MCGRFAVDLTPEVIEEVFEVALGGERAAFGRTWNAAPGTEQLVVGVDADGRRRAGTYRWGFALPAHQDSRTGEARPARTLINARSETAHQRGAFRDAFAHGRCLVPASAFYEWKRGDGAAGKQPWAFAVDEGDAFALGAILRRRRGPDGVSRTFCVLTTAPNAVVRDVHDRMPVIIDRADYGRWLDPDVVAPETLAPLLRPFPSERMRGWAVGRRVNDPRHDGPELLAPS